MKVQKYIDHLKRLGAIFTNLEADVVATLPTMQLMITCCQLDSDYRVKTGINYEKLIGYSNTTTKVLITDLKWDGEWRCLADIHGFIELFELEK